MKKFSIIILLFLNTIFLYSATLSQVNPNSIVLTDVNADEKIYVNHQLYMGEEKLIIDDLWPETDYLVRIVEPLAVESTQTVTTGSWAGLYTWVNSTDKNNKGRCTGLNFYVEKAKNNPSVEGPYYIIYKLEENEPKRTYRIFPLIPLDSSSANSVFNYQDNNQISKTYKKNAECFNTTFFEPSSFYIKSITINNDNYEVVVATKTFSFNVDTKTIYQFRINEETGKKELWFTCIGTGLAKLGIFKNPTPRETTSSDTFILSSNF